MSTVPDSEEAVRVYKEEQKQRALERDLRKWKRKANGAVDEENSKVAHGRVREISNQLREHVAKNKELRRNYNREEVEGYKRLKISGALDCESKRAREHAKTYYSSVRKMKNDVKSIVKNTGFSEKMVRTVKEHIFYKEQNLGYGEVRRFDPDYDMALSWQRFIEGKDIKSMDIILLRHEYLESGLMKRYNYEYRVAHDITDRKYNYRKALEEGKDKK